MNEELALSEDMVVSYLEDHPEFFLNHPNLLTSLRLHDSKRGVVSLVERQQQALRKKAHDLEEEITQLMTVAHHNEQLFSLYSSLYLKLMDCSNVEAILDELQNTMKKELSLSECKLWFAGDHQLKHDAMITSDISEIIESRLSSDHYYLGRLQKSEQQALFDHEVSGSVILIKLEQGNDTLGVMAILSEDANHFEPRMDTLLLGQFRQLVAKLLSQKLRA